ncbi:RagB/SusD family nutrient uptake outer membrane protein [Seonamhaeicola sp. MEBiC1930]|uniref:RagB/SusD family nutrient uptake outer membrane protein n=1 Tax=Seonamhaeicola sp. MEBiC01930 TaxID=2976768 RepID=UPI00325078AD
MKNIIKITCLLFIVVISSCSEDVLKEESKGTITDASFWNTEEDALVAIRAAYYQTATSFNGGYGLWQYVVDDLGVDYGAGGYNGSAPYTEYTNWTSTNPSFTSWGIWPQMWQMIGKTNLVLKRVPDMTIDESAKSRILGEAYGLRAMGYFTMLNWFGPMAEITDSDDTRVEIPRGTVESNYALIQSDLEKAIELLPLKSELVGAGESEYGRLTKGSVQGLLAKVYAEQGKWQELATITQQIINSNEYGLDPSYLNIFSLDNEGFKNVESLWTMPFITGTSPNIPAQVFHVYLYRASEINDYDHYNDWGGSIRATTEFYNSFESGDLRRNGLFYSTTDGNAGLEDPVMIIKHPADPASQGSRNGNDYYFIRYADILLMRAEALNNLGDISGAVAEINKVRMRAGVSDLDPGLFNQSTLHDQIFNERRWELYFEGHGKRDMKRMKYDMMIDYIKSKSSDWQTFGAERYLVLPIPALALSANPLLTQNEGI